MSRTFGRHACGRGCILCSYTPARNLRIEAADAVADLDDEIEECLNDIVIARDGTSRLDYAYDYGREVDEAPIQDRPPLTAPLWRIARVA